MEKNNKGNWIVKFHTYQIALKNAKFKVSEAGRQRVLKEKRKNVHAFVEGEVISNFAPSPNNSIKQVFYNPYKYSSFFFFHKDEAFPILNSEEVLLTVEEKKPEIFALNC